MKHFILILFFLTPITEAKIHIEPYAGTGVMWSRPINFNSIKTELNTIQNQDNQVSQIQSGVDSLQKGLGYIQSTVIYRGYIGGLRLGYTSLGLALGVDMAYGIFNKFSGEDSKLNGLNFLLPGIFASYKLPLLFRVYGSLIPNTYKISYLKMRYKNGASVTCNGAGAKFGLSYLSLPFVSVNFEYQGIYGTTPLIECKKHFHTLSAFVNLMI